MVSLRLLYGRCSIIGRRERKRNMFDPLFNLDLCEHFTHYFMTHIMNKMRTQSEFCLNSLKNRRCWGQPVEPTLNACCSAAFCFMASGIMFIKIFPSVVVE